MSEKKALVEQLRTIRAESSALKKKLAALGKQKRELFSARDKLRQDLWETIAKIKDLKVKRDKHTAIVKELKSRRDSASSEAKNLVSNVKSLRDEKDKKIRQLGIKKPAEALAAEIERLEYLIETTALPFEKEQKLTKAIKMKKSELQKAGQLGDVVEKLKNSSKKLNASTTVSDRANQELRLHASVSQKFHKEMLEYRKKADDLKAKLLTLNKNAKELTNEYSDLKTKLEEKLNSLKDLEDRSIKVKAEEEKKKKEKREKEIEKTEKELAEKMKSGKKLTMDDLIKLKME